MERNPFRFLGWHFVYLFKRARVGADCDVDIGLRRHWVTFLFGLFGLLLHLNNGPPARVVPLVDVVLDEQIALVEPNRNMWPECLV
ncbi:hypothetical protein BC938DRAFT_479640 [Jimgerdemannia flammicorona]|uniref:Uncharacterized protein n=1 Tax=Jimgerdemannia flammicorona TaxID=994334 RepID=A0A433QKF6_9FUNG|nr:hypothetical protein BC938DRAFT_479640 [Jimgerdemannia flammicorona]